MKILLTGGGTGGHFYPIIAVAEELRRIIREKKLIDAEIYFMSNDPYDERALIENNITYRYASAGKIRRYFSILNFFDLFKTAAGVLKALISVFTIYPDVIFGKGGYASFPALLAGRILRIPVIIHESDSAPGRVTAWASKFAKRIAISYPEAAKFFPEDRTAFTGNPIRKELLTPLKSGAHEFLKLDPSLPVIWILGGSLGSEKINDTLMDILPKLVEKYQVIHQTGKRNFDIVKKTAEIVLMDNPNKDRYKPFDFLNILGMRMASGIADLIISRAGSTIFEIAAWGVPSIIIPIPEEISHDQRKNAFNYARSGAAVVIEEINLSPNVLMSEVERIMSDEALRSQMKTGAAAFARKDSATLIANEIINIALTHER